MNQVEALFIRTISDLELREQSNDPYTILGISALIRKLFLDDNPLVNQINRQHQLKITFNIVEGESHREGQPEPYYYCIQDGFDPDTSLISNPEIKKVNRDQLLKCVLSTIRGKKITLREIVLFEANVMGGVHAGSPRSEKERAMQKINNNFSFGSLSSTLRQLKAVTRVVLKGLEPLKNRIVI